MNTILPINRRLQTFVKRHNLQSKFTKQARLLLENPSHPSLHVELLEPRWRGLYSFRIDRKYRAIFIFRQDKTAIEIVDITLHYQ